MRAAQKRQYLLLAAVLLGGGYVLFAERCQPPMAPAPPALIQFEQQHAAPASGAAYLKADNGARTATLQARVQQLETQLLHLRTSKSSSALSPAPPVVRPRPVDALSGPAGSRWRELEQLHSEWDMYLINLPRRQDKLACALQDFAHIGLEPRIITGVDGSKLDAKDLDFVNKQRKGRAGHRGCLYAHFEFLLHRLGRADCVMQKYHASSRPNEQRDIGNTPKERAQNIHVYVNFTNTASMAVRLMWLDFNGQEISMLEGPLKGAPLMPGTSVVMPSAIGHVWRIRSAPRDDQRLLGIRKIIDFVFQMVDFVLQMVDFGRGVPRRQLPSDTGCCNRGLCLGAARQARHGLRG